jgi:hypothetical protein
MKYCRFVFVLCLGAMVAHAATAATHTLPAGTALTGEQKVWHRISLTFDGPEASETGDLNPFTDYRLNVTFTHVATGRRILVPGYFAADGDAANTSATAGNQWRVEFAPDAAGTWSYTVSFRSGTNVAVSLDAHAGQPASFDGQSGEFSVDPTDKSGVDFRGKGRLREVGQHYLQFSGTGEYFIKTGAGSPENLLAYADFDNTTRGHAILHTYAPHRQDFRSGDPTWKGGRGQGLIGAIDYLSDSGVNSMYFLTMNIGGDGDDVYPYVSRSERTRFDVSKLAQWEVVFSHMDRRGILLHVITQERENDRLLNGGDLGLERKLYYRELVARFGHHLGVIWNLGEESTNSTAQRMAQADYINALDPYQHVIAVHTYPTQRAAIYTPLLGNALIHDASLQLESPGIVHAETLRWVTKSTAAGDKWVVSVDEIGPANVGAAPDNVDPTHSRLLRQVLWGSLMAGGAGVEWYFGYGYANNDLTCEDFRSRDRLWTLSRHAADFIRTYLPLPLITNADALTGSTVDYCIGRPGVAYAIYLPAGSPGTIHLPAGEAYTVAWYDPRAGGDLQSGEVPTVDGGGTASLGRPPAGAPRDWVVLLRRAGAPPVTSTPDPAPPPTDQPAGPAPGVTRFVLVDAVHQRDLRELKDGDTVSLSRDGAALNVRAEVSGSVESVSFVLDGGSEHTEESAPYAYAGDLLGVYAAWSPDPGEHTLRATPYQLSGGDGTPGDLLEVSFSVEP